MRKIGAAVALCAGLTMGCSPRPPARESEAADAYRERVTSNILSQRIGTHTVADLALRPGFISALTDHEVRFSYHMAHHGLFRDPAARPPTGKMALPPPGDPPPRSVQVHQPRVEPAILAWRSGIESHYPALSGFRASILDMSARPWPLKPPSDAALLPAAERVGRTLARDGLLPTLARVLELLRPQAYLEPDDRAMDTLRKTGLPVDLLRYFEQGGGGSRDVVATIARRLHDGTTADELVGELARLRFRFLASRESFRVSDESGKSTIGLIRLQLPKGSHWRGPGDGTAVDIARQVAEGLPEVQLLISVTARELTDFLETARHWRHHRVERTTVVAEPFEVSQWTQDNGKAGRLATDGGSRAATIAPRYASRRNDASEFVPAESWVMDGLAAAGHEVFQSPLAFQGGNLLVVGDLLLISEAEIARNTAFGLTAQQVEEAFRVEFGVDRVVVMPMVSFHLDYDLTVRSVGDSTVAFVNDPEAATRIILDVGIDALQRAGVLDENDGSHAAVLLERGDNARLVALLGPRVWSLVNDRGAYPISIAQHFTTDALDSAVGNFQRFLAAVEWLAASAGTAVPGAERGEAYLATFASRAADRRDLHQRLRDLGWAVVPVPSLADAELSLTYINGVQDVGRYVMPTYGGLFEPLDQAAASAFADALGPDVRIVPVRTGESQRRSGAVHCSVATYPVD